MAEGAVLFFGLDVSLGSDQTESLCVRLWKNPQSESGPELIHWPEAIDQERQRRHERSFLTLHSTSIGKYFLKSQPGSHAVSSVSHFSFQCHCLTFIYISFYVQIQYWKQTADF